MTRHRTHWFWFLAWLSCVCFTLSPLEPVVRLVDAAATPLRYAAELAAPLGLLRRPRVVAAESRLRAELEDEVEENRALLADLARHALPADPALLAGRRAVHAEVIGRAGGVLDELSLVVRDVRGLVPGLPVVCGEAYVGRLTEVVPDADGVGGRAVCRLITAAEERVGGRLWFGADRKEVLVTVGGVLEKRRLGAAPDVRLCVHQPSDRRADHGIVRVHERFPEVEPFAPLAEGLRLGRLESDGPEGPWRLVPEVDFVDGLYQVVVLAPEDPGLPRSEPFGLALEDGGWVTARALSLGDPAPGRAATKVSAGRRHGVRDGAAVTVLGPRLFGRVTHAGVASSDVSFLADPGFEVVAVARFRGESEPRVLGRLISRGRQADGSVRFRWSVRVRLEGLRAEELVEEGAVARARLFTGSGEAGLPAGLLLGDALVPLDALPGEVREIRLLGDVDPHHLRRFFVRRSDAAGGGR